MEPDLSRSPDSEQTDGDSMDDAGVSVAEASRALGLSADAVRDRIKRGALPARKVGGAWRIEAAALAWEKGREGRLPAARSDHDDDPTGVAGPTGTGHDRRARAFGAEGPFGPLIERVEALAREAGRLAAEREAALLERDAARRAHDRLAAAVETERARRAEADGAAAARDRKRLAADATLVDLLVAERDAALLRVARLEAEVHRLPMRQETTSARRAALPPGDGGSSAEPADPT